MVAVSFIGTLLISASMLCSTFVDGARLARTLGPAAWQAVDHCPVPPAPYETRSAPHRAAPV